MAEKEQVIKEKVEYNGIFDFKGIYGFAHKWLKEESYGVVEEKYSEKVSGNAKDINFEWKCSKKLSDYFKVEVSVKFEISDLSEVEVEIDGKKKKTNKGKISIEAKGILVRDPDSKWEDTQFWRFMRDTYNKYVIPSRVESMQDRVFSDIKSFKDALKSYLEIVGRT